MPNWPAHLNLFDGREPPSRLPCARTAHNNYGAHGPDGNTRYQDDERVAVVDRICVVRLVAVIAGIAPRSSLTVLSVDIKGPSRSRRRNAGWGKSIFGKVV